VSALDASAQAAIVTLLAELSRQTGIGILFISHDLGVVHQIAHKVAVMYLGKIVESGFIEDVWRDPRHPYTSALISAAPVADGGGHLPAGLAGEVPNPSAPPPGCSFHPRCPMAEAQCSENDPPPVPVGNGQVARCLFALRSGDGRRQGEESARSA
jgi:peptide/nickel transport system ATP-binding protein